jgi:DNA polymerase I
VDRQTVDDTLPSDEELTNVTNPTVEDGAASPRLTLPTISYCVTAAEAAIAVRAAVRDADGWPVGLDIETAAHPAEQTRLKALTLSLAAAKGKLAALKKAKASAADILAAAKQVKAIDAHRKMAGQAALDPHRSSIRLVQLYGGGDKVYVIDIARARHAALRLLDGLDVVAHNAQFELKHLEHASVELGDVHCTMQAARLLLDARRLSLAEAAADYLGVALDKLEQTSDWGATNLTKSQLEYAAADAVAAFRLGQTMLPALGVQRGAYGVQMAAVPAVARMELRGSRLDAVAHARLIAILEQRRIVTECRYCEACQECGHAEFTHGTPSTPAQKEAVLTALLSSDELMRWRRTKKSGALSTERAELLRAAHYPPIQALVELSRIDKLLSSFGPTLTALASPVTGRIHAHYRVAGTDTGRVSCSGPNLQTIPRSPADPGDPVDFRALFVPEPGCVLVCADYALMELRAAAHISGDHVMTRVFEEGQDFHTVTAARMTGKPISAVTREERKGAKAVNFGAIFGIGPAALVQTAWKAYHLVLDVHEAKRWLEAFAQSFPTFARRRVANHARCAAARHIVIGKDAARGMGRFFPFSQLPPGANGYTHCCNFPVQGACADAAMMALSLADDRLFAAGIEGGIVAWVHDEIVVEVCVEQADEAAEILKQAMIDGFAETFPGAPLKGLVEPHIGMTWSEAKG